MSRSRNMADLLDSNGDVKSGALDNVPPADVVNDTTPQLGGDLASNGNDITFGDNNRAIFGAGSDLQIYHSGSNSVITEQGTGNLYIDADDLRLRSASGESKITAITNGAVSLYYDNAEKLATTSTGIDVTGTVAATAFSGDGSALTGVNSGGTLINIETVTDTADYSQSNTSGDIESSSLTYTPQESDSIVVVIYTVVIDAAQSGSDNDVRTNLGLRTLDSSGTWRTAFWSDTWAMGGTNTLASGSMFATITMSGSTENGLERDSSGNIQIRTYGTSNADNGTTIIIRTRSAVFMEFSAI
jgi:hypothetical protein